MAGLSLLEGPAKLSKERRWNEDFFEVVDYPLPQLGRFVIDERLHQNGSISFYRSSLFCHRG